MMKNRVRITIEFDRPHNHSLSECADLVLHQMREIPKWDEPAATGALNYVCHDQSMEVVSATFTRGGTPHP